ncbi:MAG: YdcF family protein [Flavobacteriales bacterium]|nr:YdcF family protein [Flavobacteriales bacterium]
MSGSSGWERLLPGRRSLWIAGVVLLLSITALWWCDRNIRNATASVVFDQLDQVPHNRVGVVLGTAEKGRGGGPNAYFTHRIKAAADLYHAGKVDHLLLSGDNGRKDYNEPFDMRRALIAAGVDSTAITLDYAGFRTFDSMVRAREVFGQERFTVISQRFHNERAVYIARRAGLDVVGYNAADVTGRSGWRTRLREKAARAKVFVDIVLGVEPRFLGEPVEIGTQPPPEAR